MEHKNRILVVEDDKNIVDLLGIHLSEIGFEVDTASNGSDGLTKAMSGNYDLLVLDLMLPGIDGLSICRKVREQDEYTPILMLTARSEEMDKILGLELGADDYMTKPFSPRELTARVKALVRRVREMDAGTTRPDATAPIRIGDLTIDTEKHRALLGESEIDLTAKEYDLLTLLASHPGQAFNREQLLDRVWHYQHEGYNHTVNSHINRLRAKVESDPSNPRYIRTVWGYGYRFSEPAEFEDAPR
jgi:two-component system, OmpR family, alkaline phosphatase synthesis response regulator PhoP